ncbi:MAG: ABC transporter ATP-binding protein/permease [Lachnospiraceae bacterium]|nr:ABC transporter ATP-binding protein/permease [Lachnospiraceae bacterium]
MAKRNTYFNDEVIEKKIDMAQLLRAVKYLKPHSGLLFKVVILMFLSSVAALVPPILLKTIINVTVPEEDIRQLILLVCFMAGCGAIEVSITYFQTRFMGKLGHNVIADIRKDIFYKLQKLPFNYFDDRPSGKIVIRVTDYINGLADFFTNQFMVLFMSIFKLVVVLFFMVYYSPVLTGVVVLVVAPMMTLVFILRNSIRKQFGLHRAKLSNRTAFLVESIMGERIIKNYDRIDKNEEIQLNVHMQSVNQWWRIVIRQELNSPIMNGFWNMGQLLIYAVAFSLVNNGQNTISAGIVILFVQYMGQFTQPLMVVSQIVQSLAEVSSNLERVFETIDQEESIRDKEDCRELINVKGKVDFDNITFSYDEDDVILENFNLHVKPAETVALVGPTGAGKTTILNMLTRFYDVSKGSVRIDGFDVRDVSLHSLRKEVGVLMQDPFLFSGTVIDNIRYGKPEASDEECIEAAKRINADSFIKRLRDGYYTMLPERGEGLSSGEKQLINFVRIVLKNPSVIILDEATSSIDTETELLIQEALKEIIANKTAFMVAHRLSTIRDADRILFIDNKGIVEEGTHEELMSKRGRYYNMVKFAYN